MMFVIKGVVNLSNDEVGELAFVSYQGTAGDYRFSFFFNKEVKKSAFELSGGQQQRLCIARAMAVSPSVLLMDEPASALDPISTAKVEELIHELKKDYTIVIVNHNIQKNE